MPYLYVASDREGAGKTALCASLARILAGRGKSVRVVKPIAAEGLASDSDGDAGVYADLLDQPVEGRPLDSPNGQLGAELLERVRSVCQEASGGVDLVLIEGSCALGPEGSRSVVESLDARVLLVARYSHETTAAQLAEWARPFDGRLVGVVVNGLTRYRGVDAKTRLIPEIESHGLTPLGVLPEERRLLGVTVRQLAEHLDGRVIVCQEKSDALVEHLMVGSMGMDPGEFYFGVRDDKAVIVRGDRPDLQFAALSTDTRCLVLTKGIEPIEYVTHEAELEEVPVMVVEADTLGTMDALNTLAEGARFDHPAKLERFAELVEQHLDLPALFGALGLDG